MIAHATTPAMPVKRTRGFRLCLPVLLLWLLLLPFAPLLLLGVLVASAVYGVNPLGAAMALFRVFVGLKGIHLEVQSSEVSFAFSLF